MLTNPTTSLSSNTLFHSEPWRHAVETAFDLKIERFVPASEPTSEGWYSLIEDIRGRRVVSTPFSDFCEPTMVTEAGWGEFATHLKSFEAPTTVRPFASDVALADASFDQIGGLLWHGIDLSGGADELFARLKSKIRTKIRRVAKHGVTFRASSERADIDEMHKMHVALRKGKYSMLAQPLGFFHALHDNFGDKMQVLFAELDGEILAGMTFFEWGDTWYYKFSASYPNEQRPNAALMMHACRLASERGMQLIDMGRSDDDQPGLLAFKEQFEPDIVSLTTLKWSPAEWSDPQSSQVGATLGALTNILTDPSVPEAIAAQAGDLLYRYFA